MQQSKKTYGFWNNTDIIEYFKTKDADYRLKDFIESQADVDGWRALDLGCGGGRHSQFLVEHNFNTSAVDINPKMLEATQRRVEATGKSIEIKSGSILEIPYGDSEFDIVVTTGVLHQSQNQQQYKIAIHELSRVTKPHGYIFLNIFTNKVWDRSYTKLEDPYSVQTREGLIMTLLPRERFVELMANEGLILSKEYGEDIKEENTGPRAVYRALFVKK